MATSTPSVSSPVPAVDDIPRDEPSGVRSIWPCDAKSELNFLGLRGERGIGVRAKARFPVLLHEGPRAARCVALEVSCSGIVLRRGRRLSARERGELFKLELCLPGHQQPIRAFARVARRAAPEVYALRFVHISDVDRLALMEYVDEQRRVSLRLLDEFEQSFTPRASGF